MTTLQQTVTHRDDCIRPHVGTFTGERGDHLARCINCGRVEVLEANPDAPKPPPSRYYCAGHPEQPVTWRGTGCPECDQDRADYMARRAALRAERRARLQALREGSYVA